MDTSEVLTMVVSSVDRNRAIQMPKVKTCFLHPAMKGPSLCCSLSVLAPSGFCSSVKAEGTVVAEFCGAAFESSVSAGTPLEIMVGRC